MTENPEKNSQIRPPDAPARRPGTWRKGESGNPAGKPPGTRKRITRALEAQIADAAPDLLASVIAEGRNDWRPALELLKIIGLNKRTVVEALDLPKMENASDILAGQRHIIEQVASGEMSAEEGAALSALLDRQRQAIEGADMEQRLAALEARVREGNLDP